MYRKIAGLLGAAAALTTMGAAAQAMPNVRETVPPANSFADLLEPIPNAVNMLKADDARRAQEQSAGSVHLARYYYHHHHHHHHHHYRRVLPRFFFRHHRFHHHHHHHHRYYRSYRY